MAAERNYVMTKLAAGDWLLPSNDGQTLWRIRIETEPIGGQDVDYWAIWKWRGSVEPGAYMDPDNWDQWEHREGWHKTRRSATETALRFGDSDA